jgi:acyl transferase domain-containing protein
LWVKGLAFDWRRLYAGAMPRRVSLPTYPFAQERYWISRTDVAPTNQTLSGGGSSPAAACREQYLLLKSWEPAAVADAHNCHRRVIIWSNPETDSLARRLAACFDHAVVVDYSDRQSSQFDRAWTDCDVWVDLIGCGRLADLSFDWIEPLQQWVDARRHSGGFVLCVTLHLEPHPTQRNQINLAGASRVGLYRMLQSEYARLTSRHLDLEEGTDDATLIRQICAELPAGDADSEVGYRGGVRHRALLRVASADEMNDSGRGGIGFPDGHVLLITGGTRGIGYLCARHMVENYGVKRLVLTGRDIIPARDQWSRYEFTDCPIGRKVRDILALEALGVEVNVLSVPLDDASEVSRAIAEVTSDMGPIAGVIHAAGMVDMETPAFIRKTRRGVNDVLRAKVHGLDVLLKCLDGQRLHFVLLFSSVSSVIPALGSGHSDYAMANAYMDYVAYANVGAYPICSIQWPNWKETGMGEVRSPAYRSAGLLPHTNVEGLTFLDRILRCPVPVVMPVVVDPQAWHPERLMRHQRELELVGRAQSEDKRVAPVADGVDQLAANVRRWLGTLLVEILKIPPSQLSADRSFAEYGADSVLMMQFLRKVAKLVEEDIDPSMLYEYPTIGGFGGWLAGAHPDALRAALGGGSVTSHSEQLPHVAGQAVAADIAAPSTRHLEHSPAPSAGVDMSNARDDDIAVVGLSCRFPGAEDIDQYWNLLREGRCAIRQAPPERWGGARQDFAGLLAHIWRFDPAFFHLSSSDVRAMDPQALLLLEQCLHLWHHAGYTLAEVAGQAIGVYIGGRSGHRPDEQTLRAARNPILAVGQNYLAANIAKFFDLRGSSMLLDTACSSALVAMDLAIKDLRAADIKAAVVGGVNLLTSDGALRLFGQRQILSREFHIFDQRARGSVLGEGVGLVLLKTVRQALQDGDRIYAVVKGLAINGDGRTASPVAPNPQAQKEVMQRALARSERQPRQIEYIEANGSGSEITDLLELKAISAIYRSSDTVPCSVGSVKPNIGHPLCAEGIASFIKVVLMVDHGQFVPFLSGQQPMKHFNIDASPFYFCRQQSTWGSSRRTAAINCFGDGGTNAHVVLENWVPVAGQAVRRKPLPPQSLQRIDVSPAALHIVESDGADRTSAPDDRSAAMANRTGTLREPEDGLEQGTDTQQQAASFWGW